MSHVWIKLPLNMMYSQKVDCAHSLNRYFRIMTWGLFLVFSLCSFLRMLKIKLDSVVCTWRRMQVMNSVKELEMCLSLCGQPYKWWERRTW